MKNYIYNTTMLPLFTEYFFSLLDSDLATQDENQTEWSDKLVCPGYSKENIKIQHHKSENKLKIVLLNNDEKQDDLTKFVYLPKYVKIETLKIKLENGILYFNAENESQWNDIQF